MRFVLMVTAALRVVGCHRAEIVDRTPVSVRLRSFQSATIIVAPGGLDSEDVADLYEELTTALAGSREVSMAVGLLMMRDRVNREQAFELLRSNARSQRRAVSEVAKELLNSAENLYTIRKLDSSKPRRKPSGE